MTDPINISVIEKKLMAARTKLILDRPFLGALVLRLPLCHADATWCPTTATDTKKFYYNPEFIATLKPAETQFILAHEALHCALSHFTRRLHRVKHRWDLACDYAINPILVQEGLVPPAGSLLLREYENMCAEEIYPLIADNDMSETLDQHLYDKPDSFSEGGGESIDNPLDHEPSKGDASPKDSSSQDNKDAKQGKQSKQEFDPDAGGASAPPPPLDSKEAEDLAIQWQQRLAGAAQQAEQAGKLSGVLKRIITAELQPRLPWRTLLSQYITASAKDDYSYSQPSNRRGNPAIYPRLKSSQINTVIGIDVSGSVDDKEIQRFISEINAIKGQIRTRITLLACDSELSEESPLVFEPWEEVLMPETLSGGGTTSFCPVFTWIDQQDIPPDIIIYFTDGHGVFPKQPSYIPTLWLIKGKVEPPWGQKISLN
ncbi:MAG: hypothetical protein KAH22_08810 [Thiotrichaceae bacterium]|nr:hypothetical protein [Thiotrichaceae bacterium]